MKRRKAMQADQHRDGQQIGTDPARVLLPDIVVFLDVSPSGAVVLTSERGLCARQQSSSTAGIFGVKNHRRHSSFSTTLPLPMAATPRAPIVVHRHPPCSIPLTSWGEPSCVVAIVCSDCFDSFFAVLWQCAKARKRGFASRLRARGLLLHSSPFD